MKFQNLGDIHKICISRKMFAFQKDTKYVLEHMFDILIMLTQNNIFYEITLS